MLFLSVGMPRAGSGWHYNLIHDVIVAAGGDDARSIRKQFLLAPILTEVNCNIGTLSAKRLLPVFAPAALGKQYVIKAHSGPTETALRMIRQGKIKATYIYRDPRAALLSAYEFGQRILEKGRQNAFSHLDTVEKAVDFMREYVLIWEQWMDCPEALHVRYEDLLSDYDAEIKRLLGFLEIVPDRSKIVAAIAHYRPGQENKEKQGLHYYKGQPERFRNVLTAEQLALCAEVFGPYLERMGYQV